MFIPGFPLDSYFDLSFSYVMQAPSTEHVYTSDEQQSTTT